MKYVIKLTEKDKPYPKDTYYVCEYGGILNDSDEIEGAFVTTKEGAKLLADFCNEHYDVIAVPVMQKTQIPYDHDIVVAYAALSEEQKQNVWGLMSSAIILKHENT